MKLKLVFLFLLLALVDAKEDVEDEEEDYEYDYEEEVEECRGFKVSMCQAELFVLNISPHTKTEKCRVLWETLQCLDRVVDECAKKNGTIEAKGLEKFRRKVHKRCPRSPLDDVNQDVEYLDDVEEDEEDYEDTDNLEECKEDVRFCNGIFEELNYGDHTEKEKCRVKRRTLKCFDQVKYVCHQNNEEIGLEDLEEFRENVQKECPLSPIEICTKGLDDELLECIEIAAAETMEKVEQIHGRLEENFIDCTMYEIRKNCSANKIKEACGELASQIDVDEMMHVPADMERKCTRGS